MHYDLVQIVHSPFGAVIDIALLFGFIQGYRWEYWFLREHPSLGESTPELALHFTLGTIFVVLGLLALPFIPFIFMIPLLGTALMWVSTAAYLLLFIFGLVQAFRFTFWLIMKIQGRAPNTKQVK